MFLYYDFKMKKPHVKVRFLLASLLWTLPTMAQRAPLLAASVPADGMVNLYRVNGGQLELAKAVPVGKAPGQMCLDPTGSSLFVSGSAVQGVTAIDLETQTVVGTLTDQAVQRADGCVVSPDGKKLYLADQKGDAVFVFATDSRKLLKRIPVASSPRRGLFLPDGKLLITSDDANSLNVIDPATDSVVRTIRVAQEGMNIDPRIMALTPDKKRLVVANVSGDVLGWYHPDTLDLIADYGTRRSPQALVMAPDGKTLYVTSVVERLIAVVDITGDKEWRVESTILLGSTLPLAMVGDSDGRYLYVSFRDGTLEAVNLADKTVTTVANVKAGGALAYIGR
jgi:YVTN family beta-propeller protein